MSMIARILILFLAFAALPLRGYAALAMDLCEMHHGGVPAAHHAAHDHGAADGHGAHDSGDHDGGSGPSICSMCAGCCVGVSLASNPAQPVAIVAPAPHRIPFVGTHASGHIADRLDRPPLAL